MKKKKRLELVKRSSDPSETLRKRGRHELPAALADNRITRATDADDSFEVRVQAVLPRIYEWTVVPGPDTLQ